MKIFIIASRVLLIISLFISFDLLINLLGSLIIETQDGIAFNSFLQSSFGLFENSLKTRQDFFNAFKFSGLISFFLIVENIIISTFYLLKR